MVLADWGVRLRRGGGPGRCATGTTAVMVVLGARSAGCPSGAGARPGAGRGALPGPCADAGVVRSWRGQGADVATALGTAGASVGAGAAWLDGRLAGPLGRDDRVELRPEQVLIGVDQLEEL